MTAASPAVRSLRPLAAFAAVALAVYAVEVLALRALLTVGRPEVIAVAVTLDLTLLVPLVFYGLAVRRGGWPPVTVVPVFFLSLAAAAWLVPDAYHGTLDVVKLAVPLVELVALGYVAVRSRAVVRAYRRSTEADVPDRLRTALDAVLGPTFAARALAFEVALLRYALLGWRAPAPTGDAAFTPHRSSGYGAVLAGLLMGAVVEGVGVHLLLVRSSPTAAVVHLVVSAYAVLWLLGDWHALRLRPITVDAAGLTLRTGLRWSVRVPWADVEALVRLDGPPPAKAPGYLDLSPMGGARYVLDLRRPLRVEGPYGIGRTATRLGFRVDEPARFERRLAETVGAR